MMPENNFKPQDMTDRNTQKQEVCQLKTIHHSPLKRLKLLSPYNTFIYTAADLNRFWASNSISKSFAVFLNWVTWNTGIFVTES